MDTARTNESEEHTARDGEGEVEGDGEGSGKDSAIVDAEGVGGGSKKPSG